MKLNTLYLFGLLSFGVFSCKQGENQNAINVSELPPLQIDFDTCNIDTGCTVTFPTSIPLTSFTTQVLFKKENSRIPLKLQNAAATVEITDLTLFTPYFFYTIEDVQNKRQVPESLFKREVECELAPTSTGIFFLQTVKCTNFFTIGAMRIEGEVTATQSPTLAIGAQVSNEVFGQILASISAGARRIELQPACGQNPDLTTYQNIIQCSIFYGAAIAGTTNVITLPNGSSGFGNGDGTYTPFSPINASTAQTIPCPAGFNCNPDQNWFLTRCPGAPVGAPSNLNQCSWLSPIITTDNTAAQIGEFDSNGIPMNTIALNPTSPTYADDRLNKGRLLWSGQLSSQYNVFEANGKNPRGTSPESYNLYKTIDNVTPPTQINQGSGTIAPIGPLIYKPGATSPNAFSITDGPGNINLTNYNAVSSAENICNRISATGSTIISNNAIYNWQIPSYPMLYTLTGGLNTIGASCEPGGVAFNSNLKAFCNFQGAGATKTVEGFRAIDSLPGFFFQSTTPSGLISSSISDTVGPDTTLWIFSNGAPPLTTQAGLVLTDDQFTDEDYDVRCVSTTW